MTPLHLADDPYPGPDNDSFRFPAKQTDQKQEPLAPGKRNFVISSNKDSTDYEIAANRLHFIADDREGAWAEQLAIRTVERAQHDVAQAIQELLSQTNGNLIVVKGALALLRVQKELEGVLAKVLHDLRGIKIGSASVIGGAARLPQILAEKALSDSILFDPTTAAKSLWQNAQGYEVRTIQAVLDMPKKQEDDGRQNDQDIEDRLNKLVLALIETASSETPVTQPSAQQ